MQLFQVVYTFKFFVKYDRFTERGEGPVITIPVKIMERPCVFRPVKSHYQKFGEELEKLQADEGLQLEFDKRSCDFKEEFDKNEKKWLEHVVEGAEMIAPAQFVQAAHADTGSKGSESNKGGGAGASSAKKDDSGAIAIWSKFVPHGSLMSEDQVKKLFEECNIKFDQEPAIFCVQHEFKLSIPGQMT